jgi:Family of unknown function (DUF5677)
VPQDGPRPLRTLGLELLEVSKGYEGLVVRGGVETAAIGGLVGRQRRLLQAIYDLLDNGHLLEAQILFRSQAEFLIVQKWLQLDPDLHFPLWFIEDVRARLVLHNDVLGEYGEEVLKTDTIQRYEQARDDQQVKLGRICAERGIDVPSYPTLIEQAKAVDEAGAYALAYRYDSQAAVHPRALAVEHLLDQVPEGLMIRSEPHGPALNLYAGSAVTLLVALRSAAGYSSELAFPDLEDLDREISAATRSSRAT